MSRLIWVTAVLASSVVAAGCTPSSKRTTPPAPVYEKGRQVGAALPAGSTDASSGIETSAVAGPSVTLGGSIPSQQTVPRPETPTVPAGGAAAPQVSPAASAQLAYVPPPTPPAPSAEPMGSAVKSLVTQADAKYLAGDLTGAASLLERAVRVEPRHPLPWNRLARVRLAQGSYALGEELAKKSNALAGSDRTLQRNNWQMISEAQRAQGNAAGARSAREMADSLR